MDRNLIHNLPPGTKAALQARAQDHHRSAQAEARSILAEAPGRERLALFNLLSTDQGADIEFEPARLGIASRAAEL